MPPELPQTCSCLDMLSVAPRCPSVLGARAEPVAEAGDGHQGSRVHPEHYGTNARMIPGFTIKRRRTER